MIYQWSCLEVSIFYALKKLLCMFSIRIISSNISNIEPVGPRVP